MRILHWAFPFLPEQGGREVLVDSLSNDLFSNGHDVLVATGTADLRGVELPYRVLRLDPNDVESFLAEVEQFDADVLHLHNYLHNSILLLQRLRRRPPIVLTMHNEHATSEELVAKSRFAWVRHNVECVVAVSEFVRKSILYSGDFQGVRLERIWNGTPEVLEDTPMGDSILFLGRLVPEKGLGFLLASIALVTQKHPKVQLRVVGDGPFRKSFENFASKLGLADNVSFFGWQTGETLSKHFKDSRMVVVPSAWKEPFGLTAIEGLMHSRPVIATDQGGLPEIVKHGECGLIVQPGDVLGLAASISKLIEDDELVGRFGQKGRERATSFFSVRVMAEEYSNLYRGIGGYRS